MPKKSAIYHFRVLVDLAAMLFAREFHFPVSGDWRIHVRSDASPQHGKEYQVTEVDIVKAPDSAWPYSMSCANIVLTSVFWKVFSRARSANTWRYMFSECIVFWTNKPLV